MVQYPRTSVINHLHTDSYWVICVVSLDHWNVVLKPLECWKHLNHIPFVNKICKEIGHTSKYMAHDHALLYVYNAYQDTKFSQPATKYPYSDNNYPPPPRQNNPNSQLYGNYVIHETIQTNLWCVMRPRYQITWRISRRVS